VNEKEITNVSRRNYTQKIIFGHNEYYLLNSGIKNNKLNFTISSQDQLELLEQVAMTFGKRTIDWLNIPLCLLRNSLELKSIAISNIRILPQKLDLSEEI
jgi:hypothetical protein